MVLGSQGFRSTIGDKTSNPLESRNTQLQEVGRDRNITSLLKSSRVSSRRCEQRDIILGTLQT